MSGPQVVNPDGSPMQHAAVVAERGTVCPFASGPLLMPRTNATGKMIGAAPAIAPTPCVREACMFWHEPAPDPEADDEEAVPVGDCIIKTSLMFMAGQSEQQTMLLDDVVTALEHEGILGPLDDKTGERGPSKKQQRAAEKDKKPGKAPQATDPVESPGDAARAAELAEEKRKQDAASAAAPSS